MHYDGLFILNLGGKDEGQDDAIKAIEKAIKDLKGSVSGTQKMDKRRFERVAGDLDAGIYVNVRFELASESLATLRDKFDRDETIYRQFYLRTDGQAAEPKKEAAAA